MQIKNPAKRIFIILLFVSFIININFFNAKTAYSENLGKSRINAVLVLDSSSSMKKSDPEGLRYEAVKLFADMCHSSGDSIGIAAYGDKILLESGLKIINSDQDKQNFKNIVSNIPYANWTDTGIGLKRAVDMLSSYNNTNGSPAIILLSDGKNDPKRSVQQADADIANSIKAAKEKGYPIYTIGLNADETVDQVQLKKFSDETGGKSFITKNASDLPGILKDIFTDKFQLNAISAGDLKLTGAQQMLKFNISDINASEGNIVLMSSVPLKVQLFSNNAEIKIPSSSAILTASKKYTLVKLKNPKQGDYTMKLIGQSGAVVNINYIFNYDLQLEASLTPDKDYKKGYTIKIVSFLSLNGQKVTDSEQYKLLNARLSVKNLKDNSVREFPLKNSGADFTGKYTISDTGSYKLQIIVESTSFYRVSEPFLINIDNNVPVINKKFTNLKLKPSENKEISLKDIFSDKDGDNLSYSAYSYPSGVVNSVIENGLLEISSLNPGTCIVTVHAFDGKGGEAICDFKIEVNDKKSLSTSLLYALNSNLPYYLIGGVVVLFVIIAIIVVLLKKKTNHHQIVNHHEKPVKETKKEISISNVDENLINGFNGQVMIEIKNETTGIVDPPIFKRLQDYKSEITMHELLLEMPEFAETKKIKLKPLENKILVINKSTCLLEKNGTRPNKMGEFYIEGSDVLNIKLFSTKKIIKIQYLVK